MLIVERFGPTIGKWFSWSIGGAITNFTDRAMYQSFKGKFNMKDLLRAAFFGAVAPLLFYFMTPFITPFIKQGVDLIQKIPIGQELATAGGPAARATIGDTPLGQRLQKFAGTGGSQAASKIGDSKLLGKNLERAGEPKPGEGYAAHHIVPADDARTDEAVRVRNLFARWVGLEHINDAENGVWLPHMRRVDGEIYHREIHTRRYYQELYNRLSEAHSRDEFLEILAECKELIKEGKFPY
jgi:hypothetical protein